ncbi:DegT/DnrJ/EryC1/StrS family aminotransferase [Ancylomarina euxinus]|uniref:DegT/DnrJ/EryC1/StrS family aminotransferase n=1 Tax=Ancylomarina euxinus TaxID=2283627 RepID=A0A425Y6I9_9BACT|nr:DegT/DnrJ/EryC1/StrS family aminotransferase [Ancylomarina euxinus]MCZ4694015.1 DegT/DnrJ/EryC1/StrS family aminotransferase [Ancylomarina euxinus]MUP14565.1 DegT/DnrJ/EryC1/StrS family aminotransferase [Ancylomarina euxinus]RRG24114.1 DegT/DnrJ/EryC1/StrS family aminotransferase [Ancylomarina euxinus]
MDTSKLNKSYEQNGRNSVIKGLGKRVINVTSPELPPLEEFIPMLEDIWESKWLTNNGKYHGEFEDALAKYLGVPYISIFSNGTLALITALQCFKITGEVITTPYSFVASSHALHWNGIAPVFADIDPVTLNLDPQKIEAAITSRTTAIMPVHVYGNPCDVHAIQEIADTYGLKIIYDAAHAFSVDVDGHSVLNYGDVSILSFHATKVFNTIEGGAIICRDEATKKRIDYLKNFGFAGETKVIAPGINGKMNELQSAYGLLQLKRIDDAINRRKQITYLYRDLLKDVKGISFREDMKGVKHNYSYFPIFVHEMEYGESRDCLYEKLKTHNIYGRRYFYPLISQFPTYRGLPSASANNLQVAEDITKKVICLPIYPDLEIEIIEFIVSIIKREI